MDLNLETKLFEAARAMQEGKIVAYPTEAVYGLGCDPFNMDAVTRLLQLKHRGIRKGFILLTDSWDRVKHLVEPIAPNLLAHIHGTWPGPVSWAFPATDEVPMWIKGAHRSVVIRVTNHPIARALCQTYGGPIVSTSANLHGFPPARDERTVSMTFGNELATIVPGKVGDLSRPTEIRDAVTGEVLRES